MSVEKHPKTTSVAGDELASWRQWASQEAQHCQISPEEVDWLLQEVAGLDRLSLRLETYHSRSAIPLTHSLPELTQLWQRRLDDRVPIQYLVGIVPWRQFRLKVTPDVLIPRPETELIVDLAVEAAAKSPHPGKERGHWVDLGTGSGAIAIGLAWSFPNATIHAVDRCKTALAVARENARNCGVGNRIRFYLGSWWSPLTELKGRVSGMVSNPPYIPHKLLADLQPEVFYYEPHVALDGGDDGLTSIQHLVKTAPDYLQSGSVWLVEMMAGQGEAVLQLLDRQGQYESPTIVNDLTGRDRFALAYRR
jgi:release factor glutamine methyltransferase